MLARFRTVTPTSTGPSCSRLRTREATRHAALKIVGGHYEDDAEGWRNFGVWLLQPNKPARFGSDDPFLPPLCGHKVEWAPEHETFLNDTLHSNAKTKRVVLRGDLLDRGGHWIVRLDDREIGTFASYEQPSDTRLRAAIAGGFPLTCQVRVIREPGKPLRVAADLP
jgi:hypothetical protein